MSAASTDAVAATVKTSMFSFLFLLSLNFSRVWAGMDLAEDTTKAPFSQNFHKVKPKNIRYEREVYLRVAVEEWEPHVKVHLKSNGSFTISGPMADLLEVLSQKLNFRYTLHRPEDGSWGAMDDDGNFNGMVGMVQRNEADIALGPFGMTATRAQVVDFSRPVVIDYNRIIVKSGKAEPEVWGFLRPLDPYTWFGALLGLFCVSFMLGVFLLTPWTQNQASCGGSLQRQALKQFWDQYATFVQQDMRYVSPVVSSRIILATWFLSVLVIMRSYSGALTSLLAVRRIPVEIDSMEDFLQSPEYTMLYYSSSALTEYMEAVEEGVYRDMHLANLAGRGQFLSVTEMLTTAVDTLVRSQDYAAIIEELTIKKIISDDFSQKGKCDFHMAKAQYFPLSFCMIGRKGLPIMPAINYRIQISMEHDLYSLELRRTFQNATTCLNAPSTITVNEAYNLKGLWGVYALLFVGLFIALVVFLIELAIHHL